MCRCAVQETLAPPPWLVPAATAAAQAMVHATVSADGMQPLPHTVDSSGRAARTTVPQVFAVSSASITRPAGVGVVPLPQTGNVTSLRASMRAFIAEFHVLDAVIAAVGGASPFVRVNRLQQGHVATPLAPPPRRRQAAGSVRLFMGADALAPVAVVPVGTVTGAGSTPGHAEAYARSLCLRAAKALLVFKEAAGAMQCSAVQWCVNLRRPTARVFAERFFSKAPPALSIVAGFRSRRVGNDPDKCVGRRAPTPSPAQRMPMPMPMPVFLTLQCADERRPADRGTLGVGVGVAFD